MRGHSTDTCPCNNDAFGNGPCRECRAEFDRRRAQREQDHARGIGTRVVNPCPKCGKRSLALLTLEQRQAQPDATMIVCHPLLGGCNHGFSIDEAINNVA